MRHHADRSGSPGAAPPRPPRCGRLGERLRAVARTRTATGRRAADLPVLVLPRVPPGAQLILGRSRACDVRFLDPTVSRRHAALQRVENGWLIVDRASTHGTWVNGRRVGRAILADGDELRLGRAERMVVRL
jgi:hypothetical protein